MIFNRVLNKRRLDFRDEEAILQGQGVGMITYYTMNVIIDIHNSQDTRSEPRFKSKGQAAAVASVLLLQSPLLDNTRNRRG